MLPPVSTYRLQFRHQMDFSVAAGLIDYLKALGVSHLYASPVFAAVSGSTHGYDVTDPNQVEPGLGGREGLVALAQALKAAGLGLILDIVPNHMAASLENPWWYSVVEWGRESRHARVFDIDWSRRLTLPFLAVDFDQAIDQGDVMIAFDADRGALALDYLGTFYPLTPPSYRSVLSGLGDEAASALIRLADSAAPDSEEQFHRAFRILLQSVDVGALSAHLAKRSGDAAFLRHVHEAQPWRLIRWTDAAREVSYRRFFEISGLVGTRVEDPEIFDLMHQTILQLVQEGVVQGLRVDHVDGLVDPTDYLNRLRDAVGPDVFLLVEKILAPDETLPSDWPVEGSTGYEFIAANASVFCDEAGIEALRQGYHALRGEVVSLPEALRDAKLLMIRQNFAGEAGAIVALAAVLLGEAPQTVQPVIEEILVAFPRYRIYGGAHSVSEDDSRLLEEVLASALLRLDEAGRAHAVRVVDLLEGKHVGLSTDTEVLGRFRLRFQQLTGPLMAKAVEDTLFFRHHAVLALNEVGGELEPALGLDRFHRAMAARASIQPHGLSATATHDTKRGEDARARLYTVAEEGAEFPAAVARWRAMNSDLVRKLADGIAPEPEMEWMIYQSLLGHLPVDLTASDPAGIASFSKRFSSFLEKSMREAKLRSHWSHPNPTYEAAVIDYARTLLLHRPHFLEDFVTAIRPYVRAGLTNSLTQTAIKLMAPGIPDIYQGTERLDFSFVDPDNRRPPDFQRLAAFDLDLPMDFDDVQALENGGLKHRLIAKGLRVRGQHPTLFAQGDYCPIAVRGARSDHVVAFARRSPGEVVITVAVRLPFRLNLQANALADARFWGDCALVLAEDMSVFAYNEALTDRTINGSSTLPVGEILARQSVAILVAQSR